MRAVIQRVKEAQVRIGNKTVGDIGKGLLVLLGVEHNDSLGDVQYLAAKTLELRIFEDDASRMNLSVQDIRGEIMVVSQFTLLGDCRKGRRPSFTDAAPPHLARDLYEQFISTLSKSDLKVAVGEFQAMMEVHLTNDGPVTFILDSKKRF
ncbi:MAG: D-aminoacyl-tRNA deacylase [Proteobacteria bacterium]|nr:D-aminoacyl-tRNA deacylase [Pseudomonadota bacterium]